MSEIGSVYIIYLLNIYGIYQEALDTPGNSPLLANSLKQIRHKEKSLIKAALRPHLKQRRITRVENFGFTKLLFAFAISDFLAIFL
jgi:hypothetical protein